MAYQPIDNKTTLNTTLFTYISSGGPDYYLDGENNDNEKPWKILKERLDLIPNGDRYTLFLNQLYTNYFLIDLNMLSKKKACIVSFYTTKEFSFSLSRYGNKPKDVNHDVYLSQNAQKWSRSTVRNLEKYFEGYPDDKVLYFQFYIYKPNSYQIFVDLEIADPDTIDYFETLDGYTLKDRLDYIIVCPDPIYWLDMTGLNMTDKNNYTILCNGVL